MSIVSRMSSVSRMSIASRRSIVNRVSNSRNLFPSVSGTDMQFAHAPCKSL